MAPLGTPTLPNWDNVITVQSETVKDIPIAAYVLIAVGAYAVVIATILMIRQCVLAKGLCGECRFNCCQGSCGQWCVEACHASCDCKSPTVTGCLDAICPQRRHMNFADAIMCRCCVEECGCCEDGCQCGDCNCNMGNCDCESINCLCCECKLGGSNLPPPPPAQ
ncbi:keratin-associated protein 5-4-like [Watersipora subatra]|uniref:keratin-associated protein 5-4-like n=1 Tax=Watersipora subatra TaxID=2589382 RepID=UPI00355C05C0